MKVLGREFNPATIATAHVYFGQFQPPIWEASATGSAGNPSEFSRESVADLQVIRLASRLLASVGQQVTSTIIVTNLGRNAAVNSVLIDRLPGGVRFVTSVNGLLES